MPDTLDKFYTKDAAADRCFDLLQWTRESMKAPKLWHWFDPSAGYGAFRRRFPTPSPRNMGYIRPPWPFIICEAYDIDPPEELVLIGDVERQDFLKKKITRYRPERTIVMGNPPFGKNGKTIVEFINHAAEFADWIAFIVLPSFRKYKAHRQLNPELKLLLSSPLPRNSFYTLTPSGKKRDYNIGTVFQIWSRHGDRDLRRREPEPITHEDFEMYQYNGTKEALHFFDNEFDMAVPCQGWQDYSRRETDPDRCEKHKQWILFKFHAPSVARLMRNAPFATLAHDCGSIQPGFRKSDVVEAYRTWQISLSPVGTSSGGWS